MKGFMEINGKRATLPEGTTIKYRSTFFGKENRRGKTKKKWFKLWKTKEKDQFYSSKRSFVMDSRNSTHITYCIYLCLFYRTPDKCCRTVNV